MLRLLCRSLAKPLAHFPSLVDGSKCLLPIRLADKCSAVRTFSTIESTKVQQVSSGATGELLTEEKAVKKPKKERRPAKPIYSFFDGPQRPQVRPTALRRLNKPSKNRNAYKRSYAKVKLIAANHLERKRNCMVKHFKRNEKAAERSLMKRVILENMNYKDTLAKFNELNKPFKEQRAELLKRALESF